MIRSLCAAPARVRLLLGAEATMGSAAAARRPGGRTSQHANCKRTRRRQSWSLGPLRGFRRGTPRAREQAAERPPFRRSRRPTQTSTQRQGRPQNISPLRTQCHANTNFLRPFGNRERENGVDLSDASNSAIPAKMPIISACKRRGPNSSSSKASKGFTRVTGCSNRRARSARGLPRQGASGHRRCESRDRAVRSPGLAFIRKVHFGARGSIKAHLPHVPGDSNDGDPRHVLVVIAKFESSPKRILARPVCPGHGLVDDGDQR